ncbi:hypothetical protein NXY56_002713 [Leishmania guyanensis]|uniref:Domain (DUF4833) n=3 Tax=Viannia TaxID=37616 RepID=A0AAW3BVF6_9TRYP|nr:hypothetical protein, conserved [Leishmania guyanensis]
MSSCPALLFHSCVWEPYSLSIKGQLITSAIETQNNANADADTGVLLSPRAYVQQLNSTIRRHLAPRSRFKCDHHDTCMYIERSKNENIVAYQANLIDSKTGEPVKSGAHQSCCSFNTADPLHAYWIKINSEHVARRRARGELEDTCELNTIERKLAYGCTASVVSKEKFLSEVLPDKALRAAASREKIEAIEHLCEEVQPCLCKFVALSSWSVWMLRLPPLVEGADATANVAPNTDKEASPLPRGGDEGQALPMRDTVVVMVAVIAGQLSVLQKVYVESIEPKHFYQLPKVAYIEVHGTSLTTGEPTYEKLTN